jgi:hypothetical protein
MNVYVYRSREIYGLSRALDEVLPPASSLIYTLVYKQTTSNITSTYYANQGCLDGKSYVYEKCFRV